MRTYQASVREIVWQPEAGRSARIDCPPTAIPTPGRYVLAWSPEDADAPLAVPLFAALALEDGFIAAPPTPHHWEPGTPLRLRGPLGRGFEPPAQLRRLALAAIGPSLARLGALMDEALAQGAEVALFTDAALPNLPPAVEANPLSGLGEALTWADFLALEIPLEELHGLSKLLGVEPNIHSLPCLAQIFVLSPMPCGGVAACGACSLETRHGWKLACEDGPVFPIEELLNV
jgi:hypothetical protein